MSYDSAYVIAPSHTDIIFDLDRFPELVETVARKIEQIREIHPEVEALAGCGNSGTVLLGALAIRLKMPILVVRKTKDTVNDPYMVNGYLGCRGYLFVDDLIATGTTVSKVIYHINAEAKKQSFQPPKFVGAVLYRIGEAQQLAQPTWFGSSYSIEVKGKDIEVPYTAGWTWNAYSKTAAKNLGPGQADRKLREALGLPPAPVVPEAANDLQLGPAGDLGVLVNPCTEVGAPTEGLDFRFQPGGGLPLGDQTLLMGAVYGSGWKKAQLQKPKDPEPGVFRTSARRCSCAMCTAKP